MIHEHNNRRASGFTIVELMIAMAFISVLLLAIAMVVMQVGAIYNKGTTMKSVNQLGRTVVDDMKRTISESQTFAIPNATDTSYGRVSPFILLKGKNIINTGDTEPGGGRLCTGLYTYAWNIGTAVKSDDQSTWENTYLNTTDDPAASDRQIHLVKVRDNGGTYCKDNALKAIDPTNAVELLSGSDLAIQGFHIEQQTNNGSTGMVLYTIGITISNADREAINTVDNTCKPPSEASSLQNYCAVNEFVFSARAGSKGGQ